MPRLTYYSSGSWNATCDQCGRGFKFDQLQLRWDGAWVCRDTCWEPRQPQDFVRAVKDVQGVPVARPRNLNNVGSVFFWANGVGIFDQSAVIWYDGSFPLIWTN